MTVSRLRTQNGILETWTKTCGPIPGGLLLTHTQIEPPPPDRPPGTYGGNSASKPAALSCCSASWLPCLADRRRGARNRVRCRSEKKNPRAWEKTRSLWNPGAIGQSPVSCLGGRGASKTQTKFGFVGLGSTQKMEDHVSRVTDVRTDCHNKGDCP